MVKTWARELGSKGIRANAICPGFIETPILASMPHKIIQMMEDKVPMGRLGRPEEIANTYAWLASDEASLHQRRRDRGVGRRHHLTTARPRPAAGASAGSRTSVAFDRLEPSTVAPR